MLTGLIVVFSAEKEIGIFFVDFEIFACPVWFLVLAGPELILRSGS
jgi:hypothetical protein